MEYLFRGRSSHYRKSAAVKCIYNVCATISTRARWVFISSLFQVTRFAYLHSITISHLPEDGIVAGAGEKKINKRYNIVAPRKFSDGE